MPKEFEPLMTPAELKPLLMLSKRQPVNCAIGLSKDKDPLLVLDKKAKPRKMLSVLKKKAGDAKVEVNMSTCRFGKAEVDTETDSRLVKFVVNKEAGGQLRPKLLELLKKAGFGKCEITIDEGLDNEPDDDGAESSSEPVAAAPAGGNTQEMEPPAAAAAGNTQEMQPPPAAAAQNETPPAEGATSETQPPAADTGAVTKRLTDLVKRMMSVMGSNPAGADAMKTAAMAGQAALKSGDASQATASADTLERLLNAGAQAGAAAGGAAGGAKNGPGSVVFGKARLTWVATRKKVESEIEKLHDELQKTYKGHGVVADLEKVFRSKVEPMLANLDNTLADKLDEVSKASDPGQHGKLVEEARGIIKKYESYLGSEAMISKLDDNPFVPLSIQKTLTASLEALNKAVA